MDKQPRSIDIKSMDLCFDFSGMFLGATGAVGVGFYTGFFNTAPPSLLKSVPPQLKDAAAKYPAAQTGLGKVKAMDKILTGGPFPWRVSKRAALGAFVYSFLECKFQRHHMYRSAFDCALAGAISGGLFGARAGLPAAGYAAAGFSAYAIVSYFLYH